jgi:hypothetical protein
MNRVFLFLFMTICAAACSRPEATDIPTGSDVILQKQDGVTVSGRVIEVKPEHVVIQGRDGVETKVPRAQIARLQSTAVVPAEPASATTAVERTAPAATDPGPSAPEAAPGAAATVKDAEPAYREVTIPAGTVLPVTLATSVGSDTSSVEDPVRARLRRPVTVKGVEALPAGTELTGHVTHAQRSARVKGRAQVAFRFTRLDLPGDGGQTQIRTASVARSAEGTKKRDAATIGGGAVGGAIIGGIVGGGDGAATGAAIGGAAGTGAVLATRGKEIRVASGTPVSVRLTAPVTVRVPQ